jgi:hypothetical protein
LPDASREKLVNLLDDTHPRASQTHPPPSGIDDQVDVTALSRMVSLNFASWNQMAAWLQGVDFHRAA